MLSKQICLFRAFVLIFLCNVAEPVKIMETLITTRISSLRESNVSHMFVSLSVQLYSRGAHVNFAHDAVGHSIAVYKSIWDRSPGTACGRTSWEGLLEGPGKEGQGTTPL